MPIDAAGWYDPDPDTTLVCQGDVLEGIPLVFMPPSSPAGWILLRPSANVTLEDALSGKTPKAFHPRSESALQDAWSLGTEFVLARGIRQSVMIVTHSCDLDHRNFVQVAPVRNATEIGREKRASLELNEIRYMFYLPANTTRIKDDSYADLSQMTAVHKSYLRAGRLLGRLTAATLTRLQVHLADLHGREFGFNPRDTVSLGGEYVCANCFFRSAIVQRQTISPGGTFPVCPGCADRALWVKFSPAD